MLSRKNVLHWQLDANGFDLIHQNKERSTDWHSDGAQYLDGVRRFLGVLFKQQHGGRIHVDAELLLDARGLTLIHVPEAHEIPIRECSELQVRAIRQSEKGRRKNLF